MTLAEKGSIKRGKVPNFENHTFLIMFTCSVSNGHAGDDGQIPIDWPTADREKGRVGPHSERSKTRRGCKKGPWHQLQ